MSSIPALVNEEDLGGILKIQQSTLARLEKSNQMLMNCNALSKKEFDKLSLRFQHHVMVLHEMQKDLQSIFTRIRSLKLKAQQLYPSEFAHALEDKFQNSSEHKPLENTENQNELFKTATEKYFDENASSNLDAQTSEDR